jgi:hypothetical protein
VYEWDFDMVVGLGGVIGTLSVPNDGGRVYAASGNDAALVTLERLSHLACTLLLSPQSGIL